MSTGKFHSRANKVVRDAGDHNLTECNHRFNGQYIHYKPAKATEGKKMVKVHEISGTRELIVPDRKPIDIPKILGKSEMDRLQTQGHVVTYKDKMRMMEEAEQQKIKLINESDERKAMLQRYSEMQHENKGKKLSEIESEAKKKNLYTLQRAFDLQQEQEPEVKKATTFILAAKCKAIRDAQIAEKALMCKELEAEDRRLDMMMEQRRQKALQDEEHRKEVEEQKRLKYVQEVQHQIRENEIQRLLEAERIEEESKLINRANLQLQRDEAAKMEKKELEKQKMREDLRKSNEEMDYFRRVRAEEDRIADMRVQEFMRQKQEREAAREEELRQQTLAKEREIARLRAQQEKSQDQQALANELHARRIQEETERAWREKQMMIAKKKKEVLDDLKIERAKQIDTIRRSQALEMERDRQQFHQLASLQKELYQKDLDKKKNKRDAASIHRRDLLKQVNMKERERIQLKKETFEEGFALMQEKNLRTRYIQGTIAKKVERLRNSNIPEKYVKDVERQLAHEK